MHFRDAPLVYEFLLGCQKVKGSKTYHVSNFNLIQERIDKPARGNIGRQMNQFILPALISAVVIQDFDLLALLVFLLCNSILFIAILTITLTKFVIVSRLFTMDLIFVAFYILGEIFKDL